MKELDMKDVAIIDSLPVYDCRKTILNVGCGDGKLDIHLASMGYRVYATDIKLPPQGLVLMPMSITIHRSDIFDLSSFPVKSSPIIICSQVLEHLKGYKTALIHLLALAEVRLIITVPYRRSFLSPSHINFWDEYMPGSTFKNIHEFVTLCQPYSTSISKIRTKPEDVEMGQWDYLIVIDKRQNK